MTAELYTGSTIAAVLDLVSGAMGVENKIGESEEARSGAPPRVTWVPALKASRKYSQTAQQRPDLHMKHAHDVAPLFSVHLWADSYAAAEDLEQRLEAALYASLSGNAYELGPDGEQEGDNAASGQGRSWLFVIPVRLLRIPIPVMVFVPVKIATVTAPILLEGTLGGTPTAGPNAGVTVP